jgi:hypothetical protein
MKTWMRAPFVRLCGCCGDPIDQDAPMQVIAFGTITKVRCRICGDGPIPDPLPSVADQPVPTPKPLRLPAAMARLDASLLPLDWQRRLTDRMREPGEDG